MKTLNSLLLASLFTLSTSIFAQGHEHHGGMVPEAQAQAQSLVEIDPTASDKGGCEKCKKKGMGGGGGMDGCQCRKGSMSGGGMGGCRCAKSRMSGGMMSHGESGCPKAAALEDRIDELEKRLDLMQMLLMRGDR